MMSFVHDIIKRQYVYEGYLPNYPYHLISDKEMFDAFINNDVNYFDNNYPGDLIPSGSELSEVYNSLVLGIKSCIADFMDNEVPIPNWVYSYMLGASISVNSDSKDIHDLLVLLHTDNMNDVFTLEAASKCYQVSKDWIDGLPVEDSSYKRPYTIFGEPCVIKSLRLGSA